VFERAKIVHALNRPATVISNGGGGGGNVTSCIVIQSGPLKRVLKM
jgi:hypothetical protein